MNFEGGTGSKPILRLDEVIAFFLWKDDIRQITVFLDISKHALPFLFFGPGAHGDSFHTPPVSPVSDGPSLTPQLHCPTSPQPSSAAPDSSPPPIPVPIPSGKKTQCSISPTTPAPPLDWQPHSPVSSNSITSDTGVRLVHNKVKVQAAFGKNGSPPTSTPLTQASQKTPVPISPTKSPSYQSSTSPVVGSSSGQSWRERDSGLSQSLLLGSGDNHSEELEKLLEECKTTLGITASPNGATTTAGKIFSHVNILQKINTA